MMMRTAKIGLMVAMVLSGVAEAACDNPVQGKNGEKPNHRVHWSTRSEVLSQGFDVFRSERADGGFEKLNEKPIPSARVSVKTKDYEYKDFAIDPCKTYYYYVEAIAESGYRMKLSEPQAAGPGAKPPAAAQKESEAKSAGKAK
ncbi:MAG TPA: hypothetical protein VLF18_06085 [Tahibacter sp.]|uniref:hypothetical protein n=1 Tax=Tahibacter sp. TaxID=2056211 RepID=UPI002C047E2A|nr:hypothetical protein [Tahibacter sp.]HSX59748.1 hypothetical protein [Tahibacter sp.]